MKFRLFLSVVSKTIQSIHRLRRLVRDGDVVPPTSPVDMVISSSVCILSGKTLPHHTHLNVTLFLGLLGLAGGADGIGLPFAGE